MPRHRDVGSILTYQRRLLLNLTYVKCPPISTTFYHWPEMTVRARLTTTHRLKTRLTVNNLASEPDLLQTTRKNDNRSQITLSQPTKQKRISDPFSATLQLDRRNKMLYDPLQLREYENDGLLDTGTIQCAMSKNELRRPL